MRFDFTPEEAQPIAHAVADYLSGQKIRVRTEVSAWDDAPYRTSLLAIKSGLTLLIEAQGTLSYHKALKEFATWLAAQRRYAELYIATASDAPTEAGVLAQLKKDGVGLILIGENGEVSELTRARNAALVVTPDPTLKLGPCKNEVIAAVNKFNEVDRKDGLRDMCELVERETEALAIKAVRKNYLKMNESIIKSLSWSDKINALESKNACNPGYSPLIDDKFKADLHSFRGARNLVDHPTRGKRDNAKQQRQFAERMMQGSRLIAELASVKRKIK